VQALDQMAARDEAIALKAQHAAARHSRAAAAAEEARTAAEVAAAITRRELEQAARLRAAALRQELRHLAEAEVAAATAASAAAGEAWPQGNNGMLGDAVARALGDDAAWLSGEREQRRRVVEAELAGFVQGALLPLATSVAQCLPRCCVFCNPRGSGRIWNSAAIPGRYACAPE
jgi:hypothetical protein